MTVFSINPYSKAFSYRDKGWLGPIVLPFKEKNPPPVGFTGHAGEYPDTDQIQNWIDEGRHNIGLHLAAVDDDFEVIGIDVDHYVKGDRQKLGGDQLADLESRFGPLPATWTSSARKDGKSGIRYFRVPRGLAFRGQVDKDIECISKGYRFAVVWPSMHPIGMQYVWFPPGATLDEDGENQWDGEVPDASELPLLPQKWIDHLTQGKKLTDATLSKDRGIDLSDLLQWAKDTFHGFDEDMCPTFRREVDIHKQKLNDEATSYNYMIAGHRHLIHLAAEGHVGLDKAIAEVSQSYLDVCIERQKRDGGEDEINGELFRSVAGAFRGQKPKCDAKKKIGAHPADTRCDQFGGLCNNTDGNDPHVWSPEKHSDQLRIAYRFAKKFKGQLIHVFGMGWYYWDGKRWEWDNRGKVHRCLMEVLREAWADAQMLPQNPVDERKRLLSAVKSCEKFNGMNGVLSIASKMTDFAFTVSDLDQNAYLLNVDNGTLDLKTMELMPHNPEDKITKICRAAYKPGATSPIWEEFLERILPDQEVREYLQRLCGVSLIGTVKEHLLAILTGEGRNGKSTFYEAVLWAMGDYGGMAEPDLFMHREGGHPTGEMDLRGNRLIVVSESDRGRRLAEATMRRLTGGDIIKARHMRQDFVEFEPSHFAMLITNHLPKVDGDDPATWARMRVIPFIVVIPPEERDTHLKEKLQEVMDAILTWEAIGLGQYHIMGTAEPEAVIMATSKYQADSDDVAAFISECCETRSEGITRQATTGELHGSWTRWQKINGCPELGQRAFGRSLDVKGYPTLPVNKDSRRERQGIALKSMRLVETIAEQT